jgi:hypothetical protein
VEEQLKPKKPKLSYISTGLSDVEKDFPLLQDMQQMVENNPEMTAVELLSQVEQQIQADKLKRMKREAARHAKDEDDD